MKRRNGIDDPNYEHSLTLPTTSFSLTEPCQKYYDPEQGDIITYATSVLDAMPAAYFLERHATFSFDSFPRIQIRTSERTLIFRATRRMVSGTYGATFLYENDQKEAFAVKFTSDVNEVRYINDIDHLRIIVTMLLSLRPLSQAHYKILHSL